MVVIKQLNEHNGIFKAIVEVNGVMIPVEINRGFKSHLERNEAVIRKAEGLANGDISQEWNGKVQGEGIRKLLQGVGGWQCRVLAYLPEAVSSNEQAVF